MYIIHYPHDLEETTTKMSFSVTYALSGIFRTHFNSLKLVLSNRLIAIIYIYISVMAKNIGTLGKYDQRRL